MEILLRSGEMLVLKGERCGRTLQCGDGKLWITQKGDNRDHLLKPGRRFESKLPGRIVVTALSDSRMTLGHPSRLIGHSVLSLGLSTPR